MFDRNKIKSHPNVFLKKKRIERQFRGIIFVLFLVVPLLTACSTPIMATIPFIPLERTATHPVTTLDAPSITFSPLVTPSTTPTIKPSATPTPYMDIDFSQVEIYQGGFLSELRYFVTFKFPKDVKGEYHAIVDDNKDYKCVVLPDYTDRLYCSGPLVVVYNWADIDLYAGEIEQPVWSGEIFVPQMK